MAENGRLIGLGLALVDHKIKNTTVHLPEKAKDLPSFLDKCNSSHIYAGGSIPNTLTAFIYYLSQSAARLYSAIGNDQRGEFFSQHTSNKLGYPQINSSKPTGVWAVLLTTDVRLEKNLVIMVLLKQYQYQKKM